jgi:hypothetical protein
MAQNPLQLELKSCGFSRHGVSTSSLCFLHVVALIYLTPLQDVLVGLFQQVWSLVFISSTPSEIQLSVF